MTFQIEVSEHAYWRAAERFPGFLTETIEAEVALALAAGRVSATVPPPGIEPRIEYEGMWVWTADGRRVYAIRVHKNGGESFVVVTVLKPRLVT